MRRSAFIFGAVLAGAVLACAPALPAHAADDPAMPPAVSCSNGIVGSVSCIASKQDRKQAKNAFARGVKLQNSEHLEEAFAQFDQASKLVPQSAEFLTARERVKAQLVFNHVERGNALLIESSPAGSSRAQAAGEFRTALDLDPDNQFARERLRKPLAKLRPGFLGRCPPGSSTPAKSTSRPGPIAPPSTSPETPAACLPSSLRLSE
jgi:hypothetical protein